MEYWRVNKKLLQKIGVREAFLLSVLLQVEPKYKHKEWFPAPIEMLKKETTLSRRFQEFLLQALESYNLIEKNIHGIPPLRHIKINHEKVKEYSGIETEEIIDQEFFLWAKNLIENINAQIGSSTFSLPTKAGTKSMNNLAKYLKELKNGSFYKRELNQELNGKYFNINTDIREAITTSAIRYHKAKNDTRINFIFSVRNKKISLSEFVYHYKKFSPFLYYLTEESISTLNMDKELLYFKNKGISITFLQKENKSSVYHFLSKRLYKLGIWYEENQKEILNQVENSRFEIPNTNKFITLVETYYKQNRDIPMLNHTTWQSFCWWCKKEKDLNLTDF